MQEAIFIAGHPANHELLDLGAQRQLGGIRYTVVSLADGGVTWGPKTKTNS